MISFISDTLLREGPSCKYMLKHDIRQFTKTLSILFPVKYNTHRLGNA